MDDNDRRGDDDLLNIDLDDLDDVEDTPPMPAPQPSADAISIELEDLDEEPPAAAWQPPAAGAYPAVGPAGMTYPVVDSKSAHDLYAKAKKNPVAAIFGNLMVQMLIAGLIAGFADAAGRFLPLVCTLNGTKVVEAVRRLLGVDHAALDALVLAGPVGAGGLVLLPYFDGERTPNLPAATGILAGLRTAVTREPLARAAGGGGSAPARVAGPASRPLAGGGRDLARSNTARSDRPIRRWISCVRPEAWPCVTSRRVRPAVGMAPPRTEVRLVDRHASGVARRSALAPILIGLWLGQFLYGFVWLGFGNLWPVSYTHLRAHETVLDLVCRLLLEKKKRDHL